MCVMSAFTDTTLDLHINIILVSAVRLWKAAMVRRSVYQVSTWQWLGMLESEEELDAVWLVLQFCSVFFF